MKKLTISIICLMISACCEQPACHQWSDTEIAQLKYEDAHLAPDATLHALIRDYEYLCVQ